MQQLMVKSVEQKPAQIVSLVKDFSSELEASFRAGQVLHGAPAGVEKASYSEEKTLLSFVYDFGTIQGLMPVHEVGAPVWPEYRGAKEFGPDDVESFEALSNRERSYVERRMQNIMRTGILLPFTITALDGATAILSRRKAIEKIKEKVQLAEGQEVALTVMLTTSKGAWCDHRGLTVFIPRYEVFYGDVSPGEILEPGSTYMAKIKEVKDDLIIGSTKEMESNPWETFICRPGSVRRAVIRNELREGNGKYRVSFAPGITGIAQGAPLMSYHQDQEICVRVIKINKERQFIYGRIEE